MSQRSGRTPPGSSARKSAQSSLVTSQSIRARRLIVPPSLWQRPSATNCGCRWMSTAWPAVTMTATWARPEWSINRVFRSSAPMGWCTGTRLRREPWLTRIWRLVSRRQQWATPCSTHEADHEVWAGGTPLSAWHSGLARENGQVSKFAGPAIESELQSGLKGSHNAENDAPNCARVSKCRLEVSRLMPGQRRPLAW